MRAMRLLVPPAWQNNPDMDPELRSFFDFNSMHMEPGRPGGHRHVRWPLRGL